VHSADGWKEFLEPVLRYYVDKGMEVNLRADAAFAIPELFELYRCRVCQEHSLGPSKVKVFQLIVPFKTPNSGKSAF
jgi:hypothetical protein